MTTKTGTVQEFFDLLESPQNSLVEQAVAQGRIPIAYSCSFVPEPLLMADKLFPLRLHATGVAGTEIADNYLGSFICSYARSLLEFAMDDRYDLVKGWVFVPSCAHMQRLADNLDYLKKPAFKHTIDVPRKVNEVNTVWLAEELAMLRDKLAAHFGVDMGDASLKKAIDEWNSFARVRQGNRRSEKEAGPTHHGHRVPCPAHGLPGLAQGPDHAEDQRVPGEVGEAPRTGKPPGPPDGGGRAPARPRVHQPHRIPGRAGGGRPVLHRLHPRTDTH